MAKYRLSHGKLKESAKILSEPDLGDFNVGDGWVEGWISTPRIDHAGDYIPVESWDLDVHRKNPIALVNHNKTGPAIGSWKYPDGRYSIEKRPAGLWGRCYFNMAIPEGRAEYESYKNGHKRGFSPGFLAGKTKSWENVNGQKANVIKYARLVEASLVNIPENPDSLSLNCKSLASDHANNPEFEFKVGEPVMSQPLTAYFAKVFSVLDTVKAAKADLLAMPDGEERNQAYGTLAPICTGLTEICKSFGPKLSPSEPWDERLKTVTEVFEGFEEITKQIGNDPAKVTLAEIDAMLGEKVGKAVDEKLAAPIERINELQTVVKQHDDGIKSHASQLDNHEQAINGVVEAVEAFEGMAS